MSDFEDAQDSHVFDLSQDDLREMVGILGVLLASAGTIILGIVAAASWTFVDAALDADLSVEWWGWGEAIAETAGGLLAVFAAMHSLSLMPHGSPRDGMTVLYVVVLVGTVAVSIGLATQ